MWISRRRRSRPNPAAAIPGLFAAGEQGVWYDPSDLSTLFQDSAGTTPVTAAGQPVGLMRDKSGRGNHMLQATAGARPTLQVENGRYYLQPDGVDDNMATAAINASTVDKVMSCVGVRKSATTLQDLFAFNNGAAGSIRYSDSSPDQRTNVVAGGSITSNAQEQLPVGMLAVYTSSIDISAPFNSLRRNTIAQVAVGTTLGTGNFGNAVLRLFSRDGAVNFYTGRFYGMILRFSAAPSSAQQIASAEAWVNSKTGAF